MTKTQRTLQIVTALAGHELQGRRVTDIAQELGESQVTIVRDLAELMQCDWVEKTEQGTYRLTQVPVRISRTVDANYKQVATQLALIQQRYGE